MYSSVDSGSEKQLSGLKRLARRDLPTTPRTPRPSPQPAPVQREFIDETPAPWPALTLGSSMIWVRERLLWVGLLAAAGLVAGYGFSVVATPKYTAYSDLVVDPVNLQVITNDIYSSSFDQNSQLLDVESKLRVLTSGNVLTRVATDLNLQDDPEFASGGGGLVDLPFLRPEVTGDPLLNAVGALGKKVTARREERSYVVTLAVSTQDPEKSVRVANAIVVAFQAELAKAETDGAARTASALMERLNELKDEVTVAETAVQSFRREHGLEEDGEGESFNAQSMTLLNTRLIEAKQTLVALEARYFELTNPSTGALNADAIQTPTMVALRTQYGTMKQATDAAATLYGPLHPNRAQGDRQLAGLQAQIDAEAARYVQSIKLELDQARRQAAQIEQDTAAARNTLAGDGDAQVQLRELERDAKAKSDVYEAFLTRAREVTERTQIDTTNIRVISPATPPAARSFPPRGYVLATAGTIGGLAAGIALALGLGFLAATRRLRKA